MIAQVIRLNVGELYQLAQHIEELAQFVQGLHQQTEDDMALLYQEGWRSPSADRFYDEMYDSVLVSHHNLGQGLEQTCLTMEKIIQMITTADDDALSIITNAPMELLPSGGSGDDDDADSGATIENPEVQPYGEGFFTIMDGSLKWWPEVSNLAGNPENTAGSQYQTIDNMPAAGREITVQRGGEDVTIELRVNQDNNSCGPLAIGAILNYFGADLSAQDVFQDHVEVNGRDENFDPAATTFANDLDQIASLYEVSAVYNSMNINNETGQIDFDFVGSDLEQTIIDNLENDRPMLALINIDTDGVVWNRAAGINHWVVVDGVSTDSSHVRIWNPYSNRHEYYDSTYFGQSFVEGNNTLVPFVKDEELQADE